jgi:colicin import membrane protein
MYKGRVELNFVLSTFSMSSMPALNNSNIKKLQAEHCAQWEEENQYHAEEDRLFEEELACQAEEEQRQLEEEEQKLEEEKRRKLEEAERAYKAQLQEERCRREKGKRKASMVEEDKEDMEKELSGSNKKVSD